MAEAEARSRKVEEDARLERERLAAEEKRKADEQAARDADKAHRGKVMKSAKEDIIKLGVDEEAAKKIVLAIVASEVAHVSLKF